MYKLKRTGINMWTCENNEKSLMEIINNTLISIEDDLIKAKNFERLTKF